MNAIIYKLREIFDNNKEKRICVLVTTCIGKSAFINEMNVGQDMDELIFPLLCEEEKGISKSNIECISLRID